jgi:hypothetical protein
MTTPLEGVLRHTLEAAAQAAPEPPPGFFEDVDGLLKRRRRRRLAAAGVAITVAVVTVAVVAAVRAAPPQGNPGPAPATASASPVTVVTGGCTVRELPLPPDWSGPRAWAGYVDPSGRHVAGYVARQVGSVLLWTDGKLRVLDVPPPVDIGEAYPAGVDAAGTVVGVTEGVAGWVYRDGQVSQLPALPGESAPGATYPTAINSRGDIVGASAGRAVIWPADQPGQVRQVNDGPSEITGISDEGLMIGNVNGESRVWNRDGTVHAQPPGFRARRIAGTWVLGEIETEVVVGPVGFHYALWNLTTGVTTPLPVDSTGETGYLETALSESGAVLITFVTKQGSQPAVLRDGEIILLPPPEDQRVDEIEARAISGDGRTIVGTAGDRALLWRC